MRNRRYTNRKGPLIVYNQDHGISKAFRNLPGVDILPVTALNLLHVRAWAACPGLMPSLGLQVSGTCVWCQVHCLHTTSSHRSLLWRLCLSSQCFVAACAWARLAA